MTSPEYLQSELPAIHLFQKLGYTYLNGALNDERASISDVVLEDRLRNAIERLNPWLNENNVNNAIKKVKTVVSSSLMEANETIQKYLNEEDIDEAFDLEHHTRNIERIFERVGLE